MILSQHPKSGIGKDRKDKIMKLVFEDNNLKEAMKVCESRDRLEKVVISTLMQHKNGFNNAFYKISRNTRIIYIHAYQSYVWNKVVSRRFLKFGNKVLIGDLVSHLSDQVSEVGEEEPEEEVKHEERNVTVVTDENIQNFTILDVVMPLVGKSIRFPENEELKALYDEYLAQDEITLKMFESKSMEGG